MGYQKGSEGNMAMDSGKNDVAYTDGSFTDKTGSMRGTIKNGAMTIWRKDFKKKDAPIITISVDEVDKALKKGGANSEATLHKLAKQKDYDATDTWIDGTKDSKGNMAMDSSKKGLAYTDGSFTDKTGSMRGTIKNGAMTI